MTKPVHIIGAGLAGSEAAWQIAEMGVPVILHEMRPTIMTDAHQKGGFAELVCSNSFRSDDKLGMGDMIKLPAGGALAVDRDGF